MNANFGKKTIIIGILLIVFFAVVNLSGFSDNMKNAFYILSAPMQKAFWRAGDRASDFFDAIYRSKCLKDENDYLRAENLRLSARIAEIENSLKENKVLRQALNIGLEKNFELALCSIIAKQGDYILVDKGARQGISENMPVITAERVVCGRVVKAYKDFSRVMLITSKESSFAAEIQENDISGLIKGRGYGSIYFERIPRDKEVREGDIVVTASLGGVFPKGLLAGSVKEVKGSDAEPFQQAELRPLFDIGDLESLFIIIDY